MLKKRSLKLTAFLLAVAAIFMVSACKPKDKNISSDTDSVASTTTSNDLVSSGEEEATG